MSSKSRKVAEFALGNSLDMLVLILITFVTASMGEKLSCDEYCTALKSAQIGSSGRPECNCESANTEAESVNSRNVDSNPIYYEPVEFHPLPDISFIYQPFVISNPTSRSDTKVTTRSLSKQETEHHSKYKQKDNVIHKISIESSKNPLYLDIDIKKTPERSRSSQNYENELDDLQLIEQQLKDCIDLHLLVHLRRNESDELKQNWNVENLEKYFHISDADLKMELSKRCKQPSQIVDQSLRQIKERINVIKPQYSNYSDKDNISDIKLKPDMSLENVHEDIVRISKPLILNSTEEPHTIPKNDLVNNYEVKNSLSGTELYKKNIHIERQPDHVENEVTKHYTVFGVDTPAAVTPLHTELDKLIKTHNETKFDDNNPNTTNKIWERPSDTNSIQDSISYRTAFNKPKSEKGPVLSLLNKESPEKTTETSSTVDLLTFSTLGNKDENDSKLHENLTVTPANSTNVPQSLDEKKYSEKLTTIVNEIFSSTTQNSLTSSALDTLGYNSSNDLNIESASVRDDFINTSTFKMENDQEESSSNIKYVVIKNINDSPTISRKNLLTDSKEKSRLNENLLVNTDTNMYKYDPSPLLIKGHTFKNDLPVEKDLSTIENIMGTPNSDSIYSKDDGTSLTPTTEESKANYTTSNVNRTIIPENELQIPRIFVTEHSNDFVDSTIDGIEEIPNNDYIGLKKFEMDVDDLTTSKRKSVNGTLNSTPDDHNNILAYNHYKGKGAEENPETFSNSEVSGNLYFMFRKLLIPMRFIQAPDGELKLILDGADFCKDLLEGANDNGILSVLCNSAVRGKSKCNII